MKRISRSRPSLLAVVLTCATAASVSGQAQSPDPDPGRFAQQIEAFATWDSKNFVPSDAILFVGSSSIVYWPTAARFPGLPVVNRGFGGSHISDVNHYLEETVLKYRPAIVVFYAGDNDVGAGKKRDQVFGDFREFAERVHASNPSTQVVYLPIKPSLARWDRWPEMKAANELVERFAHERPNVHYSDVATPMLGSDGTPMPQLFVQDGLHMTPAGYDIWTEVLQRTLAEIH